MEAVDTGREVRRIVALVEHAAMKVGNAQERGDRADAIYWRGVLRQQKEALDGIHPPGVATVPAWPTVDEFAQQIRWLNGGNKMGAASLAEKLLDWLQSRNAGVKASDQQT